MALRFAPRRGTILLVEDCDEVRLGLAELLELNGYEVSDAADGEHAMDQLTANPRGFALVLLDLLLPGGMSGRELRARQLADPQLADVPTIVVSCCEPESASDARLHPAAWLEKPFRGEQLLAVVRRYVKPHEHGLGGGLGDIDARADR